MCFCSHCWKLTQPACEKAQASLLEEEAIILLSIIQLTIRHESKAIINQSAPSWPSSYIQAGTRLLRSAEPGSDQKHCLGSSQTHKLSKCILFHDSEFCDCSLGSSTVTITNWNSGGMYSKECHIWPGLVNL